jgi:diaminohydroxyphosphoribosylaminopyrimidine deaminase / 5-amino-6-(5-phosphoribosylamino)uracil reductase
LDPNPLVVGQGAQRLRAAGLRVHILPADSDESQNSRQLNIGFFSRMLRQRPWVRLKMAASLDGISALPNGRSQWITGPEARGDGHAWRARACAVLTGIGTVRQDNPRLDVRHLPTSRQPHVIVVDSRFETPTDAALLAPLADGQRREVWIVGTEWHAQNHPDRCEALRARGAQVVVLPGTTADATAKTDLAALMAYLGGHAVNELHVEAGHLLSGSLLRGGWVDECLLYLAPCMLGAGSGMAHLGPLTELDQGVGMEWHDIQRLGPDLRVRTFVKGHADFLRTS